MKQSVVRSVKHQVATDEEALGSLHCGLNWPEKLPVMLEWQENMQPPYQA